MLEGDGGGVEEFIPELEAGGIRRETSREFGGRMGKEKARKLFDSLSDFVQRARKALVLAFDEAAKYPTAEELQSRPLILKQLVCICACYMGRLSVSMIVTNPHKTVDNRVVVNEVRLEKTKIAMGTLPTDSGSPQMLVVGSEVHKWLKSKP